MNLLITGVNGFIGSNLAKYFKNIDHKVYGTTSKFFSNVDCIQTFNLNSDFLKVNKIHFDWIIHCAYDKALSSQDNINSVILFADELQKNGARNQIFISSARAKNNSPTKYALIKFEIESWFLHNGYNVIRPGLVVGEGGMFHEISKIVKKFSIIPVVANGNQEIRLIGIYDLMSEINNAINDSSLRKDLNVFYNEIFFLNSLLISLGNFYNKKIRLIKIPYKIIFYFLKVLEILPINFVFNSQNLDGLLSKKTDLNSDLNYTKNIIQIFEESFNNNKKML